MTFDPFGDFAANGYLRNHDRVKDLDIIRRLEHAAFTTALNECFSKLAEADRLDYGHVLSTHRILFDAVYPWAGQDRLQTSPGIAVSKAGVLFAHPDDIRKAIDFALDRGQDRLFMQDKPGEVMGYLAYGHPFLDGNGRTIMVIHSVMAQRASFSIDWSKTEKTAYLTALTKEIEAPGKGALDDYLRPFIGKAIVYHELAGAMAQAPGLDGTANDQNAVAGKTTEPAVQARYAQQKLKRERG